MKSNPFNLLKSASSAIRKQNNRKTARSLHISGTTGIFNVFIGLFKLVSGILVLSIFICMNAGYTLGMAIARYFALAGELNTDKQKELKMYYSSATLMLIASILYVLYSIYSIWHPQIVHYNKSISILIATITFTEIGWNISRIIYYRHDHSSAIQLIKIINLATSIISLELTQAALLGMKGSHNPAYNGFLGSLLGLIAIVLSGLVFWKINNLRRAMLKEGNPEIYQLFFRLSLDKDFSDQYDLGKWIKYPDNFSQYDIIFIQAGIRAVLTSWIDNNCQPAPEEINQLIIKNLEHLGFQRK